MAGVLFDKVSREILKSLAVAFVCYYIRLIANFPLDPTENALSISPQIKYPPQLVKSVLLYTAAVNLL